MGVAKHKGKPDQFTWKPLYVKYKYNSDRTKANFVPGFGIGNVLHCSL